MHIALVILHADPARGGAERYTIDLASSLAARGHEVTLAASSFADLPLNLHTAPILADASTRSASYHRYLDHLDTHLSTHHYDVIHAMLPVHSCDLYHPHAGLAAEALSSGHTKYPHGPRRFLAAAANQLNPKRRAFASVERNLLTPPSGPVVLCLSEYVKKTVRRHYSLPENRLATLFNAVDLHRFDPNRDPDAGKHLRLRLKLGPERIVALIIAQDFARKGLRQTILALSEAAADPLTLIVVGKDNAAPYIQLARELGVADRVIFAGPTSDPYPYYRAADLFLLPTRHDPCSLVVLEALAMGVPVISTIFNGACEIMTDGIHGRILKDPSDIAALTASIRHLLDESTRRLSSQSCLALRPQLSFDTHVDRLLALYTESSSRRM